MVERFHEMGVEPGFVRATAILLLPPAGERDEDHIGAPLELADPSADLQPIEIGHSEVEQDNLRAEALNRGQSLETPVGGLDLMTELAQQER